MQKLSVPFVMALLLMAGPVAAAGQVKPDSDDDTLRHYLSKSDAIVVGQVTEGVQRIGVDFGPANPVSVAEFQLKVSYSIKGRIAAKQTIKVAWTRPLDIGQSVPEPGQRVVLFLKASGESWATADKWFGLCPHSPAFVEHLKRVKSQVEVPEVETGILGHGGENAAIKVELRGQGLLLAASTLAIDPDGRVRLTDCVLVRLGPGVDSAKSWCATTIRSKYIVFTLDQPIRSVTDLGTRKILSAELAGGLRLTFQEE